MKKVFIYGLYEKGKSECRYIGKTNKYNLQKRLNEHINESFREKKYTHKRNWIKNIINNNSKIEIKCLEITNDKNWEEREKIWILKYNNLTNTTGGGEGGKGFIYNITYDECKKIIQEKYRIKSKSEWFNNINNLSDNIPHNPREVFLYKGWINWGDFLGTNKKQDNLIIKNYITYDESKIWIKNNLNIKTITQWKKNVKENKIPIFIPNRPDRFYKKRGWINWGDFLGTGRIANQNKKNIFLSYNDARLFVIKNNIKSISQYNNFELPINIPSNPYKYYKEWKSWGDFLGTKRKQDNLLSNNYLLYDESKEWLKNNLFFIKSQKEWKEMVKKDKIPYFIPNHPELYYNRKNRGWIGWKDFLSKNKKEN